MTFKLIHTSDWHLGKKLYKVDRLAEQKLFLDWLLEFILHEKVNGLIIAGDIFDSPFPSTNALKLYFDFLQKLGKHGECEVFIIAGNHDSGRFLEAPNSLLTLHKINLRGQLHNNDHHLGVAKYCFKIKINDQYHLELALLPYFRSYEIFNLGHHLLPANGPANNSKDVLAIIRQFFAEIDHFFRHGDPLQPKGEVSSSSLGRILVTHHLFGQYLSAGSEQGLSLSGLDSIPPSIVDDYFDYIALGHIHNKQAVSDKCVYSGSPIPFRFSEQKQKYLTLLTFEQRAEKSLSKTFISIPCFRKLITLKATIDDLENKIDSILEQSKELAPFDLPAFLEVQAQLSDPQYGLADKIRKKIRAYPIELLAVHTDFRRNEEKTNETPELHGQTFLNTNELFELYYRKKHPSSPQIPLEIKEEFNILLNDLRELSSFNSVQPLANDEVVH